MTEATLKSYPWHDNAWDKFVAARSQNHLPHALLISGADGTGKLDFARKIATALLCTSPIKNEACHNCQSCKTYKAEANPDFLEIRLLEDKQQIAVDQIRQVSEFINYTRSFDAHRVILLNPVERMNKNASNSLLKSLEEPANNTILILVASNLSRIIPTIKSRCQILALPTPTKEQSIAWLKDRIGASEDAKELLEIANGHPLKALDISNEDIKSREEFATDIISIFSDKLSVTDIAKKWEKFDHSVMLNWQISWVENLIKNNYLVEKNEINGVSKFNGMIDKLGASLPLDKQWELYQQLIGQKQYIHTSVNALLFIENMLMLWLQAGQSAK